MRPGIYPGIGNEEYHAGPGYSKSQLDLVHKSPALIEWSRRAPRSDSVAADIGTAVHCLLLEPDRFAVEYSRDFVAPRHALVTVDHMRAWCDDNGVEYKKADTKGKLEAAILDVDPDAPLVDTLRRKWQQNAGAVLSEDQWTAVHEMRDSAWAHPEVSGLLSLPSGVAEQSVYWIDAETGLLCRCRPDWWAPEFRVPADVKTTDDIDKFHWSVRDYRYDVQEAFYRDGVEAATGEPVDAFPFIVIGKRRQMGRYPVDVVFLEPRAVADARNQYREDLAEVARCESAGEWSGIRTITVPPRREF